MSPLLYLVTAYSWFLRNVKCICLHRHFFRFSLCKHRYPNDLSKLRPQTFLQISSCTLPYRSLLHSVKAVSSTWTNRFHPFSISA